MAKNNFLDFSTTAADNTDIAGIGIQGTNSVSNFDNAFRTLMAILRGDLDNGVVFVTKAGAYTAVAGDNNTFYRFTAAATLSLTAAATLGADWHLTVFAAGGDVTIDPNGAETINGAGTLVISAGSSATIICTGTEFFAASSIGLDSSGLKWLSKGIGELYAVNDTSGGVDVPPTSDPRFRYIALSAGLSGAGGYNSGVLDTEVVSGSAPRLSATGIIRLAGSPLINVTVRLINTERRFLRAGSPGTLEDDTFTNHRHIRNTSGANEVYYTQVGGIYADAAGGGGRGVWIDNSTGDVLTVGVAGTETRGRNIGTTYYMRIK